MHLVAIGWLYVALMMSLTERSFIAGLMTFVFYGLFPLSIVLYLLNARLRGKTRRRHAQRVAHETAPAPGSAESPAPQPEAAAAPDAATGRH